MPWRARWLDARRRLDDRPAAVPAVDAAAPATVVPAADDAGASAPTGRRVGRGVAVAVAAAEAVVAVLAGFLAGRLTAGLSTLPIAYCASPDRQCKVPGTELRSGAALVAHCVARGQQMWNYDLRDPTVGANPDRAASAIWYRGSFPDGRVGYLSEVYLSASSRGGLGLSDCSPGA